MGAIAGLVLAAGASTRLGRPKQSLMLGDLTLLEHVVRNAESSCLDRVIVVVNEATAAREGRDGRAEHVVNTQAATGASSSLQAGLDALEDRSAVDAVMVMLGDMPDVTADIIDSTVAAWRASPSWAAVSEYAGGDVAHPFVFSADAFPQLRRARGDKAVWRLLDGNPGVARITHDLPTPPDVDTWDDYRALCAAHGVAPEDP